MGLLSALTLLTGCIEICRDEEDPSSSSAPLSSSAAPSPAGGSGLAGKDEELAVWAAQMWGCTLELKGGQPQRKGRPKRLQSRLHAALRQEEEARIKQFGANNLYDFPLYMTS